MLAMRTVKCDSSAIDNMSYAELEDSLMTKCHLKAYAPDLLFDQAFIWDGVGE